MVTEKQSGTLRNAPMASRASGAFGVRVTDGPSKGRTLALTMAVATVGRHPSNDLVLADAGVSGAHLQLGRRGTAVHIRDLGSTNGTWLWGHRLQEAELGVGAELRLGASALRIELVPEAHVPVHRLHAFGRLVGRTAQMSDLFATLQRIAPSQLGVLVQGETGTGKEEVARAIHGASPRRGGPFVVIDATTLPESIVDSILFGHERGAFTGADRQSPGFFEAASGGTVFIDELGELPMSIQAKFLRVLERQEFTRVGGHAPIKVDVRVVAATNRDLRNEVEAGRFREDLFYRVAQVHVHVPPLRDRPDDIDLLAARLLEADVPSRDVGLHPEALAYLREQTWPGNVRELRNVLLRAVALSQEDTIRREDVVGGGLGARGTRAERAPLDLAQPFADVKEVALERFEVAYLAALMRRCGGNLSHASRDSGLARHYLRELLKKRNLYGLDWSQQDPDE